MLVSGWCRTSCNGRSRRLTLHPVSLLTARSRSPTVFDPVPVRLLAPPVANRGLTTAAAICFRSWIPSRFPLFVLLACANSSLPGAEYDAATNWLTTRKPSTSRAVTFTCVAFAPHAALGFHLARRRWLSPSAFPHSACALCVRSTFASRFFRHSACASCLLRTCVRSVTGWMRYPARCLSQPARFRVLAAPCCLALAQPYATPTNRIRDSNNGLRRCPTPISALAAAALRPACNSLRNCCFSILSLRFVRRPVACNHAFATAALPAAPGELLSQIRLLLASLGAFALVVDRLLPLSLACAYKSC